LHEEVTSISEGKAKDPKRVAHMKEVNARRALKQAEREKEEAAAANAVLTGDVYEDAIAITMRIFSHPALERMDRMMLQKIMRKQKPSVKDWNLVNRLREKLLIPLAKINADRKIVGAGQKVIFHIENLYAAGDVGIKGGDGTLELPMVPVTCIPDPERP